MVEGGARVVRRAEGVVQRALDDEILVYDLQSGEVHCLAGVTARVWDGLTEPRSTDELAALTHLSPAEAQAALEQLATLGLLAVPTTHVSRRQLLRGAVIGGGALVALPAVQTVLAPAALAACSTGGITQLPTTLADQWLATRTAGASTTPPNGLGGFSYVYGATGIDINAAPTTLFSAWEINGQRRRWVATISGNQVFAGDYNGGIHELSLMPVGSGSGVGVRYTVPAGSTTATLAYTFSTAQSVRYYVKNGAANAVESRTGEVIVACATGPVDVYFYITGDPGRGVPLAVTVTYA
jgi:hypothetical protein